MSPNSYQNCGLKKIKQSKVRYKMKRALAKLNFRKSSWPPIFYKNFLQVCEPDSRLFGFFLPRYKSEQMKIINISVARVGTEPATVALTVARLCNLHTKSKSIQSPKPTLTAYTSQM